MSFSNAVRQREEMITSYKVMLETETNPLRIESIKEKILLCEEEIQQLKTGKPLFGRPKPLRQTVTLIESNPEKKGAQKITKVSPPPPPSKPSGKKFLANTLRGQVQNKKKRAPFNNKIDDEEINV